MMIAKIIQMLENMIPPLLALLARSSWTFFEQATLYMQREISRPLLKNLYGVKTTWMAVTIFARKFSL